MKSLLLLLALVVSAIAGSTAAPIHADQGLSMQLETDLVRRNAEFVEHFTDVVEEFFLG